jgi:hypothetical protein
MLKFKFVEITVRLISREPLRIWLAAKQSARPPPLVKAFFVFGPIAAFHFGAATRCCEDKH